MVFARSVAVLVLLGIRKIRKIRKKQRRCCKSNAFWKTTFCTLPSTPQSIHCAFFKKHCFYSIFFDFFGFSGFSGFLKSLKSNHILQKPLFLQQILCFFRIFRIFRISGRLCEISGATPDWAGKLTKSSRNQEIRENQKKTKNILKKRCFLQNSVGF